MQIKAPLRLTIAYSLPFSVMIIFCLVLLIIWEKDNTAREQSFELREKAHAIAEQVMLAKFWNAIHGGVYVEMTDETKASPYLRGVDLISISGRHFMRVDPPFMAKQLAELTEARQGYRFRLISPKPLNPANVPDAWEGDAFKSFETGRSDESAMVTSGDGRFYRYMIPVKIERPCANCHERLGFHTGDITGGISLTIPVRDSDALHEKRMRDHITVFVAFGGLAIMLITFVAWTLSIKISKGIEREIEHKKLKATVELSGAAAHEIRQPLTIIMGFAELIESKIEKKEVPAKELQIIAQQCKRINEILTRMLQLTEYKTKRYSDGTEILDFGLDSRKYDE